MGLIYAWSPDVDLFAISRAVPRERRSASTRVGAGSPVLAPLGGQTHPGAPEELPQLRGPWGHRMATHGHAWLPISESGPPLAPTCRIESWTWVRRAGWVPRVYFCAPSRPSIGGAAARVNLRRPNIESLGSCHATYRGEVHDGGGWEANEDRGSACLARYICSS